MAPITNANDKPIFIVKKDVDSKRIYNYLSNNYELGQYACSGNYITYSYEKAICQAQVIEVPKVSIEEVDYEELKAIPSERGFGKLGSSNK